MNSSLTPSTPPEWLPQPGMFATPQERRDEAFARKLAARRRRLLLWSAPLVVLALLVSAKLLSATLINSAGSTAYGDANYVTAETRFENLKFFNVVEPWKAPFNEGTTLYAAGDFFPATQELEAALDLVPRAPEDEPRGVEECAVRTNYSLALEGLGDENLAAEDPVMATDYYDRAQEMLADCASSGNGTDESEEAEERQQERQEKADEQQQEQDPDDSQDEDKDPSAQPSDGDDSSASPSDSDDSSASPSDGDEPSQSPSDEGASQSASPSPSEGQGTPQDPKEQELQDRNDEANQTGEQETGDGQGSGQNW